MTTMPNGDAAFMWETEALRASRRDGAPADRPTARPEASATWTTLREAHYETGIPVETLRKWARKAAVPSFLDDSPVGVRRMVRLDAVRRRAADLGRPIAPIERPAPPPPPAPAEQPAVPRPEPPAYPDPEPTPEPRDETETTGPGPALPADTMIVPVAAWDKMLMQLGNLHEAGQQLAEARERAAKAETEATFLRERLGEMRADLARSRRATAPDSMPDVEPVTTPPSEESPEPEVITAESSVAPPAATEKLWRYVYRGWRARR